VCRAYSPVSETVIIQTLFFSLILLEILFFTALYFGMDLAMHYASEDTLTMSKQAWDKGAVSDYSLRHQFAALHLNYLCA
jgi:hypothetical protein